MMAKTYFEESENKGDEYINLKERELKELAGRTKLAFQSVKRDIENIKRKTNQIEAGAKLWTELRNIKSQLSNCITSENFTNETQKIKSSVDIASKAENLNKKLEQIEITLKKCAEKDKTEIDIHDIKEMLSTLDVKKVDLAAVEAKVNAVKNEFGSLGISIKQFKDMQNDFVKFRKEALTTYKFSLLEKWLNGIEKDVANLMADRELIKQIPKKSDITEFKKWAANVSSKLNTLQNDAKQLNNFKSVISESMGRDDALYYMLKTSNKNMVNLNKRLGRLEKMQGIKPQEIKEAKTSRFGKKKNTDKKPESRKTSDKFYAWLMSR